MKLEAAKSKVAQLKQLTIPRLELQAAVLASCQAKTIYESRIELNGSFKPFVSSRVGEIQSNSSPRQWQHIPGQLHVEDDITREIHVVAATTAKTRRKCIFLWTALDALFFSCWEFTRAYVLFRLHLISESIYSTRSRIFIIQLSLL